MATPSVPGAGRAGVRANEEEEQEGYPEGWAVPEPPPLSLEEAEKLKIRLQEAVLDWAQKTHPGLTEEERKEKAEEKWETLRVHDDLSSDAARAHAAYETEEDNADFELLRVLVPREAVFPLPGSWSPTASMHQRLEDRKLFSIANSLQKADGLSPEEAMVRAHQSPVSRHEGGGLDFAQRFESFERMINRPGAFGAVVDIAKESAVGEAIQSGVGYAWDFVTLDTGAAPAEDYYGGARGKEWWTKRSTPFNVQAVFKGHADADAFEDVLFEEYRGVERPWYETVEMRAHKGKAYQDEIDLFNKNVDRRNELMSGNAEFIDLFGQWVKQREAFLEEVENLNYGLWDHLDFDNAYAARNVNWIGNYRQGTKRPERYSSTYSEDRAAWGEASTFPKDSQLYERVEAAVEMWKMVDQLDPNSAMYSSAKERLDRALGNIPNDMFPDSLLRTTHRNTYGESSFATRAGHVRNSTFGDISMAMNPIFELATLDLDFSGTKTSAQAWGHLALQTASTLYHGWDNYLWDWTHLGLLNLMPEDIGLTAEALYGNSAIEDFKKFFDNEELVSDNLEERKAILYRMALGMSRAEMHLNKFVLDVPELSRFKDAFLSAQDFPVAPEVALNGATPPGGGEYLTHSVGEIMDAAKESAESEGMTLEEYVNSETGWANISQKLNKLKLYKLPHAMSSGLINAMGGYEGFRKHVERYVGAREHYFGREDRQAGNFALETLGNAMSDTYIDGGNIRVTENTAGSVVRIGSTLLFDPVAETAMDLLFDPFMELKDQLGGRAWHGRANDRGGIQDWFYGLENPEAAGFMGRLQDAALNGLRYDKTDSEYRNLIGAGIALDVWVPGEGWALTAMSRPLVGSARLVKLMEDIPGMRISSDTLRAAYLPEGVFGAGSLWEKIAPAEDIADYERAVDVAEESATARRDAEVDDRSRFQRARTAVFGDPEVNLAKKRLKRARAYRQGTMGWRSWVPGAKPRELKAEFGGMHDITKIAAEQHFNNNLTQGVHPLEGFGSKFRSNVYEVMRRAGVKGEEVDRVLRDSSQMRSARFLSEAAERLTNVDDYTMQIRESALYSRLRDELEAANHRTPLHYKNLRGVDAVDAWMAMVETIGVAFARTRGLEDGLKATEQFMQQRLAEIDSGRLIEPPSRAIAGDTRGFDSAKQGLMDGVPSDQIKIREVNLDNEAELLAMKNSSEYETVRAIGDKQALRSMSMSLLVTLLGRVEAGSNVGADILGEIAHRLSKEFADSPGTAQSKFDEFVELLSQAEEDLLSRLPNQADRVQNLFDNILNDISERVRLARETLDESSTAKATKVQADTGRAQIVQAIRKLVEGDLLEAEQGAVLEALVMSLPERVLRDIRLSEQIAGIARGNAARSLPLLSEGGPVDRLISSVEFYGFADEVGTLKAGENALFVGATIDEVLQAIRFKRDENQGFKSLGIRYVSKKKNPDTGKAYTARELAEKYVDAETWMRRQQGESFSPEKIEQLVDQFEKALHAYKKGSDRVGPRTYQFLHELGHAISMSFLSDSEIAILSKAFRDELDDFGLFRDTPYTREFSTMTDVQFTEWFAENFAEYVITHQLPKVLAGDAGSSGLLRIFSNIMERLSNYFSSWFRRAPRAKTDFHPALANVIDRLFDGKAAAMASRREIALRRASRYQMRLSDEGIFSTLSVQRSGLDGQYIPELDDVEVAEDLLRMDEGPQVDVVDAEKSNIPSDVGLGELSLDEANAAMRQAKTGSQLADFISENASDPVHQRIAERIKPHLNDTEVHVIEGPDDIPEAIYEMEKKGTLPKIVAYQIAVLSAHESRLRSVTRGLNWSPEGDAFNDVFLRGNKAYSGTTAETALHELVHAATVRRLSDGNLSANKGTALQKATSDIFDLRNQVVKIAKQAQKDKTLDPAIEDILIRATANEKEFVAYGLTNKTFQDYLMTIKVEDKSMWNVFVEKIADLLGVAKKDQNALTDLVRMTDELLDAPLEELPSRPLTEWLTLMEEPVGAAARAADDVEITVAAVGMRPEFMEAQLLMNRANEARASRDAATNAGTRRMYQRQLDTANRRLYLLLEPDLKKALTEGLDPDVVQITNLTEAGGFERSLGAFADYAPEGGFYVTLKGPRDIILGRVAEYSRAYNQDAMLVRERIKTVDIDKTKPLIEQISFDDKGVQRGATARIVIPRAFEGKLAQAIMQTIAKNETGATIRLDTLEDGRGVIELVHVPEWIPAQYASVETFRDIVEKVAGDIKEHTKKKKLGDVEVTFEQESVYAVSHSRGAPDAANNPGLYEYWIERSRNQLREQGRDAAPLFELAEEGVGTGPVTRGPRLQPGGDRPAVNGSNSLLDIPGAARRIGPEIRRVLNERDAFDSGHLSEELAAEFNVQSEIAGGTPHDIVDLEVDSGLKQRISLSEITPNQASEIKSRLGTANPLEDVSFDVEFTVERVTETPEGKVVERSKVSVPVFPVLKATDFAGAKGQKVLIPGGMEGTFSFSDVQYLARRPIEMILEEAATKWWDDLPKNDDGVNIFGKREDLGNYDEIMAQYKEAYSSMLDRMYDKLHNSYGLEKHRPKNEEIFDGGRFKSKEAKFQWEQEIEIHMMDVASQYVFAYLSMQTNLLDNQAFAAVVRPRSFADLSDMVNRYRTAKRNKGSDLDRDEANHILGFSLTLSEGVLKNRFGKKTKLADVETDILPIIQIHDWTKPGGPLITVQSVDIAPLNADKIAGKTRKALARYVKSKEKVAKKEALLARTKDASKRKRIRAELRAAIKEMQAADVQHQALLNSVSTQDVVQLTGDIALSSPANTTRLLEMYEMMHEDFLRVQKGELKHGFFERYPGEDWDAFSDRVSSMVPGMATKISAFGIYWQNPIAASIGALDIHMIGMIGPELFKEQRWLNKAEGWYRDWQSIKSDAAKKHLKEVAETALIRDTGTEPTKTAISKKAKEMLSSELKERARVSFEDFLSTGKSNPAYTFWREQLRGEITAPEKYLIHPTGVPEYKRAFDPKRIDSNKIKELLAAVKANKKLTPKQRKERTRKLERALFAHEHIENAQRMYGADHPIIQRFVKEARVTGSTVDVMSPEYKKVLDGLHSKSVDRDIFGDVATLQHRIWDEWRGYLDPHVIVHPGSAMLPAVRPAALKAVVKALEDSLPEIRDPRVQAELTRRHSRLTSGLFGRGFRELHSSFKEGRFGGTSPFEDRPLPTELSRGALYIADSSPPSSSLDVFLEGGSDMADFFNHGDLSSLFNRGSNALMMLLGEEFPMVMDIFVDKFDSIVADDGSRVLTERGFGELKESFSTYWHDGHVRDPRLDIAYDSVKDRLAVFWRRLRHSADRTNPGVRRFFDEWLGVLNDAKKEAMLDVKNSAEFKNIPKIQIEEFKPGQASELLETEQVAKRGRAREEARIDMDEGRIRYALGLTDEVTEVDAFSAMEKAVGYVATEMSRLKHTNHWVSFSTRSVVPARLLPKYLEEAQLRNYSVFGDPHVLKKQFERIPLERVKLDEFGEPVMDTPYGVVEPQPVMEVVTEVLPDGTERVVEIDVINLNELQQDRLKQLLIELAVDPRTKQLTQEVLGEYLLPNANLDQIPFKHYEFITQELLRDHVVGIGSGMTKEIKNVPRSLGFAAVKALMGPRWLGMSDNFQSLQKSLSQKFKTRAPLAHMGKNKDGKVRDGQVVSPIVQELFQRRMRQIDDIPNWIKRVQSALANRQNPAGVWEVIEGLQNVLEQPIHQHTYRVLDRLELLFMGEAKGINPNQVGDALDDIARAFADNRLMTKSERAAINLLRDFERIKILEPERTMVKGDKVYIKDPAQREAIADAYMVIQEGIARRLEIADQHARIIMEGMGGSPEQKVKLFRTGDGQLSTINRDRAIRLYDSFYKGEWGALLDQLAREGLSTGTALKYPGRFNVLHAMLETVIRLRAQSIFMDLVNDMTDMGMSVRIEDLAPKDITNMAEKRAFAQRVKLYLNEELKFGGPLQIVDETGRVYDATEAFERVRTEPLTGQKLQGAGPGAEDFSREARARARKIGAYKPIHERMGDVIHKIKVHDLEAFTVATQLIEQWGMKIGANIENWELVRFADGSEALVPKLLLDEVQDAMDRVAGQASARQGVTSRYRLQPKGFYEGFLPEVGQPPLKTKAKVFVGDAINLLSNSFNVSYRLMKMGLTSGLFIVNLPYYMANAFGAQLQAYQALGLKGYFSSMSRPMLALEISAALWGDAPTMRWTKVKPVVMPDGTVWTKESLTRAAHEHGLSGSFLSKETARTVAEDLKKKEPTFWNKMTAAPKFYHAQLINFATFLDNYHRVAIFVEQIGKGASAREAAAVSRKALFDYSDLTDFEKKYMRQIFIFYSFQRKNIDLFWDTLLTNPHRVMGQLRFARGLNQTFLDGDERLIESDWSLGRVGVKYQDFAASRFVQKTRYNAPIFPVQEALRGQLDFLSFLGSFLPGEGLMEGEKRLKARLKFLGRLNPWLQAPMALTLNKTFFGARPMRPERIPLFMVQHDLLTTGGIVMRSIGAEAKALKRWEEQDYPGQTHAYYATNTTAWYLLQNLWHGPLPVMPMREDIPGTSKIRKFVPYGEEVGEALDHMPLGYVLRARPLKGLKEGTLSYTTAGRMMDTIERLNRAGGGVLRPDIVDAQLRADMAHYKGLVESGRREPLFSNIGEEERLTSQELNAAGFRVDPETGNVAWRDDAQGVPVRGARGRPGIQEGWLSIVFSPQKIYTEEYAILMEHYRYRQLLKAALKKQFAVDYDKEILEGRYISEGSD